MIESGDGRLPERDKEARARIAGDLDTTFLVEAGAGSGKTASLVARMTALIRERRADVRRMAAITFTNQAADELKIRFRAELERQAAGAKTGPEKETFAAALRHLPECFIGTVHSFCGKLLRERPVEAGVDPAFRELEDREDEAFRDRCWDEYLHDMRVRGIAAELERFAELGVDVNDLHAVYERMSRYTDVDVQMTPVPRPDFNRIRRTLMELLSAAERFIPAERPDGGWDALQQAILTAKRHMLLRDPADDRHLLPLAKRFDRHLQVTLNRWTDLTEARRIREAFAEWQRAVLRPFLRDWREHLHPLLIAFVLPAVHYCRQRRMAAGRLNFQDLLMKAAELLRTQPNVRAYFAEKYTHLLVDEFQDTDPLQAEMMLLLTGSDVEESDWRKQRPRPGSLFVVGDPKQSIYRFRRADISTYQLVKKIIGSCGEVLELTQNYRSVKAIGDFVNYAFESKFMSATGPTDVQTPFMRMSARQPNPRGKGASFGVYVLNVPKMKRDRQRDIVRYDAEHAARYIAWACAGNLRIAERDDAGKPVLRPAVPGDFLILLKHRKYLHEYAEALERNGIAADLSGSETDFAELRGLALLARVLHDPADGAALLAVLRGMLFGVSDEELFHYTREAGAIDLTKPVPATEKLTDKAKNAAIAIAKLQEYLHLARTLPAWPALMRMVDDLGLIPAAAVGSGGSLRAGTLVKLLEQLAGDAETATEWPKLTARLRQLTEQGGLEAVSLSASARDAVRLMNVHKAKGLEAPVVWLACPCGDRDHDAKEHIDRLAEPPRGYFVVSRAKGGFGGEEVLAQPAGWTVLAEKERDYMRAEADRLLYVAATRAKQLLIVSRYPSRPAIDPWSGLSAALAGQPELEVTPVRRERPARAPADKPADADAPLYTRADASASAAVCLAGERLAAARPSWVERTATGMAATFAATASPLAAGSAGPAGATAAPGSTGTAAMPEAIGAIESIEPTGPTASFASVESSGAGNAGTQHSSIGFGAAFGRLIHRCLQALGEGMALADLPIFCRLAAAEEGIGEENRKQAEAAVRTVLRSSLWQRAMNAFRKFHEFSFLSSRRAEEGDEGPAVLLRGVIDLVFEEAGGWVIVDFKTDVHLPEQERLLTEHYAPQVRLYAAEWRKTTGYPVKEIGLYLIHTHRYVVLD